VLTVKHLTGIARGARWIDYCPYCKAIGSPDEAVRGLRVAGVEIPTRQDYCITLHTMVKSAYCSIRQQQRKKISLARPFSVRRHRLLIACLWLLSGWGNKRVIQAHTSHRIHSQMSNFSMDF
jgi:hypothetical protein